MLAHHFAEAEDLERALDYSRRAANNARKLYAAREELEHREHILSILERKADATATEVIDATLDWVFIRHRLANYEGVLDRLDRAVSAAREIGDKQRLALALSWTANTHMVMGFPSQERAVPARKQRPGHRAGQRAGAAAAAVLRYLVDSRPRSAATASRNCRKSSTSPASTTCIDVLGHAMAIRAITLARLGRLRRGAGPDQGGPGADSAHRLPGAGRPTSASRPGMALYEMGELEAGLEQARLGAELAYRANGMECACAGYFVVGKGELERHRPDEAVAELNRSLKLADVAGFEGYVNMIHGNLAMAEFEKGSGCRRRAAARLATRMPAPSTTTTPRASLGQQLAVALMRLQPARRSSAGPRRSSSSIYRDKGMRPSLANALELLGQTQRPDRQAGGSQARPRRSGRTARACLPGARRRGTAGGGTRLTWKSRSSSRSTTNRRCSPRSRATCGATTAPTTRSCAPPRAPRRWRCCASSSWRPDRWRCCWSTSACPR